MANNNESNSIKSRILNTIEAGKVQMRPRWQFILRASLLLIGTILIVLSVVYLTSFIIFITKMTPGPGPDRGVIMYLTSLPWLMILVAIIFVIILELLVRRYSFAYRKPLLYTIIGIAIFTLVTGFIVAETPLHRHLMDRAEENHLPFGNQLYRGFDPRYPNDGPPNPPDNHSEINLPPPR